MRLRQIVIKDMAASNFRLQKIPLILGMILGPYRRPRISRLSIRTALFAQ